MLVVDDNATNRVIVQEVLASWGMDAIPAVSGEDALQALRATGRSRRRFDLVLLDHQMPRMDGLEVLRRLRADPELRDTPVILLSSLEFNGVAARSADAAPDAVMTKPVFRSALFDRIADTIARRTAPSHARALAAKARTAGPGAQGSAGKAVVAARNSDADLPSVLVVEDNRANQIVVQSLLGKLGYSHRTASNGLEAVELYRSVRFEVVIMDVSMPGMNGLDATRAIRGIEAEEGRPPARIVGLTAHAMEGDRQKCVDAGMDGYLTKPITQARLAEALDQPQGAVAIAS